MLDLHSHGIPGCVKKQWTWWVSQVRNDYCCWNHLVAPQLGTEKKTRPLAHPGWVILLIKGPGEPVTWHLQLVPCKPVSPTTPLRCYCADNVLCSHVDLQIRLVDLRLCEAQSSTKALAEFRSSWYRFGVILRHRRATVVLKCATFSYFIQRVNHHRQFDHKYRPERPQIHTGDTDNNKKQLCGFHSGWAACGQFARYGSICIAFGKWDFPSLQASLRTHSCPTRTPFEELKAHFLDLHEDFPLQSKEHTFETAVLNWA